MKSTNKNFGILLALILTLSVYRFKLSSLFYFGSVFLLMLAFVRPIVFSKFNYFWILIGESLHKLMSPLILTVIYFFLVFPISVIMRLLKRNLLNIKFDKNIDSYWQDTVNEVTADTIKNQF